MTYNIQHFGRAVLKLCAHSGTTDVRALKHASRPFDRGALRDAADKCATWGLNGGVAHIQPIMEVNKWVLGPAPSADVGKIFAYFRHTLACTIFPYITGTCKSTSTYLSHRRIATCS